MDKDNDDGQGATFGELRAYAGTEIVESCQRADGDQGNYGARDKGRSC